MKKETKIKVEFENEEEAIKYYQSVIRFEDYDKIDMNFVIGMTKQHGYIKESPLESARELYYEDKKNTDSLNVFSKLINAGYYIGLLEKRVKELEK